MDEITRILNDSEGRASGESDQSLDVVYRELKRLAASRMAHEASGHTLQPTALVHEAWLRLVDGGNPLWNSREHFFCAAARAMRRILVESARHKGRLKRGGGCEHIEVDQIELPIPMRADELLALDEALDRLSRLHARAAEVVNLRFFAGLTHEQAARELDISVTSVERLWVFARAWLYQELRKSS